MTAFVFVVRVDGVVCVGRAWAVVRVCLGSLGLDAAAAEGEPPRVRVGAGRATIAAPCLRARRAALGCFINPQRPHGHFPKWAQLVYISY